MSEIKRGENRRIYKYVLKIEDKQSVTMFAGQVLSVQMQYGELCVWILANLKSKLRNRVFYVVGTGHPLPDDCSPDNYCGTAQTESGQFVWHVFEEI